MNGFHSCVTHKTYSASDEAQQISLVHARCKLGIPLHSFHFQVIRARYLPILIKMLLDVLPNASQVYRSFYYVVIIRDELRVHRVVEGPGLQINLKCMRLDFAKGRNIEKPYSNFC